MKARGWVVPYRRLTRAMLLLLGGYLFIGSKATFGQRGDTPLLSPPRQSIATSVAVTPETTTAPRTSVAPTPSSPRFPSAAPVSGAIQQVVYVPDPSNNVPPSTPSAPTANPTPPMLPPSALLSGMSRNPAAVKTVSVDPTTSQAAMLSVDVVGPDRLLLGKPLVFEIVICNRGARPIAEVHIEQPLPEGVLVLNTDPPAASREHRLTWDLRQLEAGGDRRLKIELNPGRVEVLDLRPFVTFLNSSGLRTRIMRPPFSIEISSDRTRVTRGERIRFNIQLANNGLAPIRNIKIYDRLPSGLHHPMGKKIGIEHFGDLQPGQRCTIALETTAVESGSFRNEVMGQADLGVEANAALDVVVTEPNLSLHVEGPERTVTQREVDFRLEVANPAALAAKNVRLVQALPPTFEVISAGNEAALDINQHALVWSLPELGAGHRQTFTFRIKATFVGDWPMSAVVLSQNFPEAKASNTLHAEAAAVLKVEVNAPEELLTLGEETELRVRVFNNGDAPCTGVGLKVTLPDSVTLIQAKGPSSEQVDLQQVRFAPLAQPLDAHGDVVYRLHLRGNKAGKGSLHIEATADKQTPAVREVSVQVQDGKSAKEAATVKHDNPIAGQTLR